jgi:hypothetical protein
MPDHVPTSTDVGTPESWPVAGSNAAQDGLAWMLKLNGSPSKSYALGRNEYVAPAVTAVAGEPEIVGGVLATAAAVADETLIEKAGSADFDLPSLTQILMLEYVPAAVGVPLSLPVALSKLAQAGRLLDVKVSVALSGSLAFGTNS